MLTFLKANWILFAVLAGLFIGACIISYNRGYDARDTEQKLADAEKAAAAEKVRQERQAAANAASAEAAKNTAAVTDTGKKTNEVIVYEIQKVPVYRDCIVPDDGVQALNDSIAAGNNRP